ncbi:MAG: PaaI family thioesterase [Pseudomonadota bacterium]|nr:PaaI family thioesterase [Pseudomonadota bacterium]
MQEQHFKKLENMYHAAPFQELIKSKLKISEGEAELEMEIDPILHHAADAIHGFVYFKMMDDVAIFAANSLEKEFFLLTSSFNLYFLRPVQYGKIRGIGKVVSRTKTQYIAEAVIYNDENKEIGRGSGIFAISRKPFADVPGYKYD